MAKKEKMEKIHWASKGIRDYTRFALLRRVTGLDKLVTRVFSRVDREINLFINDKILQDNLRVHNI